MNIIEAINSGKKFTADCEESRRWFNDRDIIYLYHDSHIKDEDGYIYSSELVCELTRNWKLKPYRSVEDIVRGIVDDCYFEISNKQDWRNALLTSLKPYLKDEL